MPRNRYTERVLVVRTDIDGNILDYDIVEQPMRPIVVPQRSSSIHQSQPTEPQAKFRQGRSKTNEENSDENNDVSLINLPLRKTTRDPAAGAMPVPRPVLYAPKKPSVKIFSKKVNWKAGTKIDTHNEDAIEEIRRASRRHVYDEQSNWSSESKPEVYNPYQRQRSRVYNSSQTWNAESKIDSHNEEYRRTMPRRPKSQIYDQKLRWYTSPKVDTHNEELIQYLKSAPKPVIYDEKFQWLSGPQVDHQNEEYLQHRKRLQKLRDQSSINRTQSFPQEYKTKIDHARVDHFNPDYIELRKQKKITKLPQIEDQKFEWKKVARVDQRNEQYLESIQQERPIPTIFRQKVQWKTKTPQVDDHNEEYLYDLKDQRRPRIVNRLPEWYARPKIYPYNDRYDRKNNSLKPLIVNEKVQWKARPKINTGLAPDPNLEEYVDYGLTT